jgi:glycosyltransferase 2 family protein
VTSTSLLRALLPRLALSIALGILFVWIISKGGLPLIPPSEAFDSLAWWALPSYLMALVVTHLFRATRFRFLIRPLKDLPLRDVIALNWIGFFAIFAFPLRLGEMARPMLTKMRHGISVSAGIGTVAVERVFDGLLTSFCVAYGLFVLPTRPAESAVARALPGYGTLALTVFGGAFVAVAFFLWQRERATWLTKTIIGAASPRLGDLVASKVDSVAEGLRSMASARLLASFTVETLVYWSVNALGMWLLARGCGIPISFGQVVGVMGIMAIGILLPAGPGLFGAFQLSAALGLSLYFPAEIVHREGSLFIFLLYVVQAVFISIAGLVPLYAMNLRLTTLVRPSVEMTP